MLEFHGAAALVLVAALLIFAELLTGLTIWGVARRPGVRARLHPRIWRIYWVGVGIGVIAVLGEAHASRPMTELATTLLYYGDNLDILRRYLPGWRQFR